jgi:aspartate kinase
MHDTMSYGQGDPISVVKFGGSSFTSPQEYQKIAHYVQQKVAEGNRLVVVVSAMSGTTGSLAGLLEEIAPSHSKQDRDAVLGTGEILAAALMRAALEDIDIQAVSLNGFQLGWTADSCFTDGTLTDVSSEKLLESLATVPVCVVSGGQALTSDNRLVMLGRNSSDLSAIAAAMALKLSEVTIFSDVEGVCSADPYLIEGTRLISELCFEDATAYSKAGAKVLYDKCVELAYENQIDIQCAALTQNGQTIFGTRIGNYGNGVQVCMPKSHVVIEIPNDVSETLDTKNLYPVRDRPGFFVINQNADILNKISPNYKCFTDTLAPIMCFSQSGDCTAYAVVKEQQKEVAQKLHDELLIGTEFTERSADFQKKRGTHTDVFQVGNATL